MSNNLQNSARHILVFPFPAQGHLIPMLDLARHLSLRGFTLTIVITPKNLPLILPFLSTNPASSSLVLHLPHHPSLPPGVEHVRHLPSRSLLAALMRSLAALSPEILHWAHSHPDPPSFLLSDFFLGSTVSLARDLGIPRIAFFSSGALLVSIFDSLFLHNSSESDDDLPSFSYAHLPSFYRRFAALACDDPDWIFARDAMAANPTSWAAVINTFHSLERPYLARLKRAYGHSRVWAVGPLAAPSSKDGSNAIPTEDVAGWLDGCPSRSVVYIGFGSQFLMSQELTRALAEGLDLSGARFVWAAGGSVLPDGWEPERGIVVRGWSPQREVLGHEAVGTFLTHCGWNSAMEGVAAGVVLLAWPMEADQFVNARLLVEETGVAVRVWEGDGSVPDPTELARVLRESVEEGAWPDVRARAAEMGRRAAEAVAEGGTSADDMEGLVREMIEFGGEHIEGKQIE